EQKVTDQSGLAGSQKSGDDRNRNFVHLDLRIRPSQSLPVLPSLSIPAGGIPKKRPPAGGQRL
ncbi:hypothetical protein NW809_12220, partial [Synechococcus sp. WC101]